MKPPGAPCGGWPGGGGPLVPADGACTGSARTSGKGAAGNRFCCAGGAGRGCAGAGAGRAARGALVCTTGPSSNSPAPVRSGPPPSPVAARAPAVADCGALSGGAAGLGGWRVSFFSSFSPPKIACWLPAVTQCSCRSAVVCARHHGWATRAGTRARSTFLGTDCTPAAPPVSGSQEAMPSSSCPCRPARHQGRYLTNPKRGITSFAQFRAPGGRRHLCLLCPPGRAQPHGRSWRLQAHTGYQNTTVQANLLAPPHLRRSVRLGHAIQQLHQAGTSEQEQATSGGAGYDAGIIIGRPDLQNDEHPVLAVALAPGSDAATSNKSAPSIKEGEADTGTQGLSVEVKERNEEQLRPLRMRKLVKYENWNGS